MIQLLIILFFVKISNCSLINNNVNVVKLPSLYWSSNNRLFINNASNSYLRLNAHIGDSIDLVCPRSSLNDNLYEYSIIYKVSSKYEFENCIINPNNYETVPILKCDKQNSINPVKFTIYFVKFSPVPNALEFEEEKEYYFLSTSSGTKDGINFMSGGLCSNFNMKFSIKIDSSNTNSVTSSVNSSFLSKLINKMNAEKESQIAESNVNKSSKRNEADSDENSEKIKETLNLAQMSKLNSIVSGTSSLHHNLNFIVSKLFLGFFFVNLLIIKTC